MSERIVPKSTMIGLISDTHDNIAMIDKAVKKLNEREMRLILHAGDYISPFTVKHFKSLNAKLIGVFGNNCAERNVLKKLFSKIGADLRGFFAEIKVEGLKIALIHGHNEELLHSLVESEAYDLVVHGHTHRKSVKKNGKTLVINPGEICGYLSGESTLALVNLKTRSVETLHL